MPVEWPPSGVDWYYADDWIAIAHGDCRDALPKLTKVDLVLTDPPYGLGSRWQGGTWGTNKKYLDARRWDVAPDAETIAAILQAGEQCVIWGGNHFRLPPTRGLLAWFKTNALHTMADFEVAWTSTDRPAKAWHGNNNRTDDDHATSKPLNLMLGWISFYPDARLILDPFMGSGTTLRAAKDLSRRAIGIEIEEKYCAIAARRLEQEVMDFSPVGV